MLPLHTTSYRARHAAPLHPTPHSLFRILRNHVLRTLRIPVQGSASVTVY
ncbi:MAG: hypothetical protein AMXMBFR16_05180 [Candidatus Uhrbacteria bacterium]